MKRFSLVIAFLVAVTLGLIVLAYVLHGRLPPEFSPTAQLRTDARIAPAGAVYAGDTGAAAQAAAKAAALAALTASAAYGGTLDGEVIYNNLCGACHTNGVGMAPKLVRAEWTARIAQGEDQLYRHAIEGFTGSSGGIMPARGGNPGLSDEQVKVTIDWMLGNLQ